MSEEPRPILSSPRRPPFAAEVEETAASDSPPTLASLRAHIPSAKQKGKAKAKGKAKGKSKKQTMADDVLDDGKAAAMSKRARPKAEFEKLHLRLTGVAPRS